MPGPVYAPVLLRKMKEMLECILREKQKTSSDDNKVQ